MVGTEKIEGEAGCFSVFDTERMGDDFYVFDALFVNEVDVRHLPLLARLREARRYLPPCASFKRYHWGPSMRSIVQELALSHPRLRDGTRVDMLEGFIFVSLSAGYDAPPVKFKFGATCDFLVTSQEVAGHRSCLHLHVLQTGEIVRFRPRGDAPGEAFVSSARAHTLGLLPTPVTLVDCVVLEMRLVVSAWQIVRRRHDRLRPNTLRTVIENLELQKTGKCEAKFLLRHLDLVPKPDRVLARVSDTMLRTLGVCAAMAIGAPAAALFLPDLIALQAELDNCREESAFRAVAVVAPSLALLSPSEVLPPHILRLEAVMQAATLRGWRCTPIQAVRAGDFLHGCSGLPPALCGLLGDVTFLVLSKATLGPASKSSPLWSLPATAPSTTADEAALD